MLIQSLREADSAPIDMIGEADSIEAPASADWRDIAPHIDGLNRIDVRFDSFKDGRGFTLAAQLREKAGYRGELRAVGDLVPDQAQFLKRVGFDAILPAREDRDADWARALDRFSHAYQPASADRTNIFSRRAADRAELTALNAAHGQSQAEDIIAAALERWAGRIAILSSFGAEAAVGLHMVARIAPDTPVIFLDTGKHFAQTEQYRRQLAERLGLTRIVDITPDGAELAAEDASGDLWERDPDACCALRKVRPLGRALAQYDALITGRKQLHLGERLTLPAFQRVDGRIRVNPLASWTSEDVEAWFKTHDLPRHPLTEQGYRSIGCWTCTSPVAEGEDVRAGRWRGREKTECGIHAPSIRRPAS